jgi:hypothetical protein
VHPQPQFDKPNSRSSVLSSYCSCLFTFHPQFQWPYLQGLYAEQKISLKLKFYRNKGVKVVTLNIALLVSRVLSEHFNQTVLAQRFWSVFFAGMFENNIS